MTILKTQTRPGVSWAVQKYDKYYFLQTVVFRQWACLEPNMDDYAINHVSYNHFNPDN